MSKLWVAVSVFTESGDSYVFHIDFTNADDVVNTVKDMMDEELAYISEFKLHCPWGVEIEDEIKTALILERDAYREWLND